MFDVRSPLEVANFHKGQVFLNKTSFSQRLCFEFQYLGFVYYMQLKKCLIFSRAEMLITKETRKSSISSLLSTHNENKNIDILFYLDDYCNL